MKSNRNLLYFSLNPYTIKAFHDYISRTFQDRRNAFSISHMAKKITFRHASDLASFLERQQDLGNFYVIIDYLSFFNCHLDDNIDEAPSSSSNRSKIKDNIKENNAFSVKKASEIIAKTILCYPEVRFMFDESWKKENHSDGDFTDFLFYDGSDDVSSVLKEYHQYRVYDEQPFAFIQRNWDNLYDGSNLRFAIKRYIYKLLMVKRYNFSAIQDSRSNNMALSVEEEHFQNRLNSYALYANGFRVLPISSSQDLKRFKDSRSPSVIIRDYDLQFPDEDVNKKETIRFGDDEVTINAVDYIRGAKLINETSNKKIKLYKNRWHVLNDEYWSSLINKPIYFISKGGPQIKIVAIESIFLKEREKLLKEQQTFKNELESLKRRSTDSKTLLSLDNLIQKIDNNIGPVFLEGVKIQVLQGLEKPVSGVYLPFHYFKEIKERYNSFGKLELYIKKHAVELAKKCKCWRDKKDLITYLNEDVFFKTHFFSSLKIYFAIFRCKSASDFKDILDKDRLEKMLYSKDHTFELAKKCRCWRDKLALIRYLNEDINFKTLSISSVKTYIYILRCKSVSDYKDILDIDRYEKRQEWSIKTDRENHDHGVPLDLYDLAKCMIERASRYYKQEKYIKSAVISSETIEVLNGFHEALMLQAYHILATSENAIAMNTIGSSESALKKDAKFRIKKIEHDVDRMLTRSSHERRDLKYNFLNQIFIDCRNFCQAKKHFGAEECFISAMAHVNEGFNPFDILYVFINKIKMVRNSWETYKSNHLFL